MELMKGIAVSPGVVIREALVLDTEEIRIPQRFVEKENVEEEVARYEQAILDAQGSMVREVERIDPNLPINIQILNIHKDLLGDPALNAEIVAAIRDNQYTAEHAVSRVLNRYIKKFEGMDSPIFAERVHDLYDIEKRILNTLLGNRIETLDTLQKEVILIARNLTPAQTAKLDTQWVKGIATDMGGKTSHTAIMARALGIPAVVALGGLSTSALGGDVVAVDGFRGVVIVNPDERTEREYQAKERNVRKLARRMRKETALPSQTIDGYPIEIQANIELPQEVHTAVDLGATGIGLFRSEFIHVQAARDGEENHFQTYKSALRELGNRPMTVRTLDIRGDKEFGDVGLPHEENPLLGAGSLRYCLEHPDVFRRQLRALLRVSAIGKVRVMLPMVGSLQDLHRTHLLLDEVRHELNREGVAYDQDLEVGVMVEVPSIAVIADLIAPEVDFLSVGTNDLVQYTLAVDRGNEQVASLYQPAHPAILRMLVRSLEAGQAAGIEVTICGEMASDPQFIPLLIGLGFRHLSVSPTAIPEVKRVVRSIEVHRSRELAATCLGLSQTSRITAELRKWAVESMPRVMRRW